MTTTIHRAARRKRFVIVDQSAVEDARLSWAARGLLAYLLSRPDDWKVIVNDLKKRGDLGRDGIYALLKELRETGYVRYERNRDDKGRMRGGTYIVSEIPEPHPVNPDAAKPGLATPAPAGPGALPTTDITKRITTTTTPTTTYRSDAPNRCRARPIFPDFIPEVLHGQARKLVAGINDEAAQLVIDEWAGALAACKVRKSAVGYLKALVDRFEAGELKPRYARQSVGSHESRF